MGWYDELFEAREDVIKGNMTFWSSCRLRSSSDHWQMDVPNTQKVCNNHMDWQSNSGVATAPF
jgi:hypothetical protein